MILGIGIDLLNTKRVEKLYLNYGEKLKKRILSELEIKEFEAKHNKINFISKKFCIKEAFSKALGTGIGRGINFIDINITNDILGKPIITLSDKGRDFIENLYKTSSQNIQINVSVTDEDFYVNAFVVISL